MYHKLFIQLSIIMYVNLEVFVQPYNKIQANYTKLRLFSLICHKLS